MFGDTGFPFGEINGNDIRLQRSQQTLEPAQLPREETQPNLRAGKELSSAPH
jgi:hypothetical protein